MPKIYRRENKLLNLLRTHSTSFFVLVALVSGVIISFRIPPLFGNDEIVHFPRAYHVQAGHLWAEHLSGYDYGAYLPSQLVAMNHAFREQVQSKGEASKLAQIRQQYGHEKISGNETQPLSFTSANVYSAWSYLPAAIGMWIADLFHLPLVWYIYLARLGCLLVWLTLVYFAIRIIPVGKYFLMAVALLPTSLVQASTIGLDGVVNGLAWLIVALTLAIFAKKIRMTPKTMVGLAVLCAYLATTKQGYALIAALPLLVPTSLYSVSRARARTFRLIFASSLIIVTYLYIAKTGPIADTLHFIQRPGLYVDAAAQIKHILTNPVAIIATIVFAPFSLSYLNVYAGVVGVLTNKLVYLPVAVMFLLYAALALVFAGQRGAKELRSYRWTLLAGGIAIVAGTFLLINLALYVSFTTVGNPHIEGVQGRYLLPLAPLFILMKSGWPKPMISLSGSKIGLLAGSALFIGLLAAVSAIG
jgi:uncharacterized membrane protein